MLYPQLAQSEPRSLKLLFCRGQAELVPIHHGIEKLLPNAFTRNFTHCSYHSQLQTDNTSLGCHLLRLRAKITPPTCISMPSGQAAACRSGRAGRRVFDRCRSASSSGCFARGRARRCRRCCVSNVENKTKEARGDDLGFVAVEEVNQLADASEKSELRIGRSTAFLIQFVVVFPEINDVFCSLF